jgi:hypothetical protein
LADNARLTTECDSLIKKSEQWQKRIAVEDKIKNGNQID